MVCDPALAAEQAARSRATLQLLSNWEVVRQQRGGTEDVGVLPMSGARADPYFPHFVTRFVVKLILCPAAHRNWPHSTRPVRRVRWGYLIKEIAIFMACR
jgi:hypothetical protein